MLTSKEGCSLYEGIVLYKGNCLGSIFKGVLPLAPKGRQEGGVCAPGNSHPPELTITRQRWIMLPPVAEGTHEFSLNALI